MTLRLTGVLCALVVIGASCGSDAQEESRDPVPTTAPERATTLEIWEPTPGTTWQWQLSDLPVDTGIEAEAYDIDLFDNGAEVVSALHDNGRRVICYVSVGTWEPGRPDSGTFPPEVRGRALEDFPDEQWLDIRALDTLMPLIEARLDLCADKGFDAVEPDNVDGYANDSGFELSAEDQLRFNRRVAAAAHARGLAVGLKNDLDQIPELVDDFDFAVNEECAEFDECDRVVPFIERGKAVFHVEYALETAEFCDTTTALGFSSLRKDLDLTARFEPCARP